LRKIGSNPVNNKKDKMDSKYISIINIEKYIHFKDDRTHTWFKYYVKISTRLIVFDRGLFVGVLGLCMNSHNSIPFNLTWLQAQIAPGEPIPALQAALGRIETHGAIATGSRHEIDAKLARAIKPKALKEPKEYTAKQPRDRLLLCHKILIGIPLSNAAACREWDRDNYAKEIKAADRLLELFNNDMDLIKEYMSEKQKEFTIANIKNWTVWAYVRPATLWLSKRGKI
jgi:hypothetical protein